MPLYVNEDTDRLNQAVCRAAGGRFDEAATHFEWASPIEADQFRGVSRRRSAQETRAGAPGAGPGDVRARLGSLLGRAPGNTRAASSGFLIEAKSYPSEVLSRGRVGGKNRRPDSFE